jgi:hypothetical protein
LAVSEWPLGGAAFLFLSVACYQQRQDVEALRSRDSNELNRLAHSLFDNGVGRRIIPRNPVDGDLAGGGNAALQSPQAMMSAPGNDAPACGRHDDDLAVAPNAVFANFGFGDLFAAKALHGISPQLGSLHGSSNWVQRR